MKALREKCHGISIRSVDSTGLSSNSRLSLVKICGKSKDDKGGLEIYGRVLRQLTDIDKIYLFMNLLWSESKHLINSQCWAAALPRSLWNIHVCPARTWLVA